jgi:hypothetical protein
VRYSASRGRIERPSIGRIPGCRIRGITSGIGESTLGFSPAKAKLLLGRKAKIGTEVRNSAPVIAWLEGSDQL